MAIPFTYDQLKAHVSSNKCFGIMKCPILNDTH